MEHKAISDNYNKSAEQILANRLNAYQLNTEEKEQVWQIVGERDNQIKEEKAYFKENFEELKSKEHEKLRGEEQPKPQYTMEPKKENYNNLASVAQANVQNNHYNTLSSIEKNADKQINSILKQSKERENQSYPDIQQDFKNAHDNNNDMRR